MVVSLISCILMDSRTVGVFDKAGSVDTICILLKDLNPTAEKLCRSDPLHLTLSSSSSPIALRLIYYFKLITNFQGGLYMLVVYNLNTDFIETLKNVSSIQYVVKFICTSY